VDFLVVQENHAYLVSLSAHPQDAIASKYACNFIKLV